MAQQDFFNDSFKAFSYSLKSSAYLNPSNAGRVEKTTSKTATATSTTVTICNPFTGFHFFILYIITVKIYLIYY